MRERVLSNRTGKTRYAILDRIRGVTVISMLLYHMVWDLVYLFHMDWEWYESVWAYLWQQSICWSFILLSGFCSPLGGKRWRRGALVSACGLLITIVTLLFMPRQRIVFGVLTCLGSCMLLVICWEKLLARIPAAAGLTGSILLFALFRNVNEGFLGFETLSLIRLPELLYRNLLTTYLGFPYREFYSADYFSLFPWLFLFMTGYFLFGVLRETDGLSKLAAYNLSGCGEKDCALKQPYRLCCKGLEWTGRHSLGIYIVHQPILYVVLAFLFHLIEMFPAG